MKIFDYDGPIITTLNRFVDYVLLGLLWMVASLPIITFGASTTSMIYTEDNVIHQGKGHLFSTFWKRFFAEFKQAFALWLLAVLIIIPLSFNLYAIVAMKLSTMLLVLNGIVLFVALGWMQLWFGYLSKFDDRNATVLLNTLVIAKRWFLLTALLPLLALTAMAGIFLTALTVFPLAILVPGMYVMLAGPVYRKILQKFLTMQVENKQELL